MPRVDQAAAPRTASMALNVLEKLLLNQTVIGDIATLTGAARVALGTDLPAMFCNDDGLAADLEAAASTLGKSIREIMGALAAELADEVVLTDDNPRTEDAGAIVTQIASGIPAGTPVRIERNRRRAIELALTSAQELDAVLIAAEHELNRRLLSTCSRKAPITSTK